MKPTVRDVMTRDVVTVDALAQFKEVVRLMQEHRVSALPVVDADGVLVGIVSEGDLILRRTRLVWKAAGTCSRAAIARPTGPRLQACWRISS
jgi:CBS-domain-containing membrane protein